MSMDIHHPAGRAAQAIADRYFAAMRSQDLDALCDLFDAAGVIVWPDGRAIEGRLEIRAVYTQFFQQPPNNPEPGSVMIGPESFSTEVMSRFATGETRRTINIFRLAASGLIARMDSYRQG